MATRSDQQRLTGLAGLLGLAALLELLLLRTGTRTLVHIPGLGRIETSIGILAEVGRLSYYLTVVSLAATLGLLAYQAFHTRPRRMVAGAGALVFLVVAGAGRLGLLPAPLVAWCSLVVLVSVVATAWRGIPTLPIGFFVIGSLAASLAVLGQGSGGGIDGRQVDLFVLISEVSLILAAITSPLLLNRPPPRSAIFAGLGAFALGTGGFTAQSSTLSILVLWNLGVPGWLPGVGYGLALGSLMVTVWGAMASGQRLTVIGLALLAAGGIGTISTYQTGLALAGVLLLGHPMASWVDTHPSSSHRWERIEVSPRAAPEHLGI